jgi:hypothetical protein
MLDCRIRNSKFYLILSSTTTQQWHPADNCEEGWMEPGCFCQKIDQDVKILPVSEDVAAFWFE